MNSVTRFTRLSVAAFLLSFSLISPTRATKKPFTSITYSRRRERAPISQHTISQIGVT